MRKFFWLLVLGMVSIAHAAPASGDDELNNALTQPGLISQLVQVRQSVGEKASDLVENAMGFIGVPYRRGGSNAQTGFDCSGFVRSMYEQTVGNGVQT